MPGNLTSTQVFIFLLLGVHATRKVLGKRFVPATDDLNITALEEEIPIPSNASFFESSSEGTDFFFAILADPQIGMLNAYNPKFTAKTPDDIKAMLKDEVDIFNKITGKLKSFKKELEFVAVLGDMQQYYPTDSVNSKWLQSDGAKLANAQREAVKAAVAPFPVVHYLPGNHDIDDKVGQAALSAYRKNWGKDYYSFLVKDINFIVLDSQLYHETDLTAEKNKQTAFFQAEMKKANGKNVVLTHIPPYIKKGEKNGWGNWHDRSLFTKHSKDANFPKQWFCGHLHKNVETIVDGVEVVVTSSCASTMDWGGPAEFKNAAEASAVTSVPQTDLGALVGATFFAPGAKAKIAPGEDRSGLRIVKCNSDYPKLKGQLCQHKWYTFSEFNKLKSLGSIKF